MDPDLAREPDAESRIRPDVPGISYPDLAREAEVERQTRPEVLGIVEPDPAPIGVPAVEQLAGVALPAVPVIRAGRAAPAVHVAAVPSEALAAEALAAEALAAENLVTVGTVLFPDFYREARDGIARALTVTLGDQDLAVEAVDEAMARAYQRWSRVGGLQNPGGWVYRVALNWSCSVLRRRRRAPHPRAERGDSDIGPVSEPAVMLALADLDVRQRAVVVCRYLLGWSEEETAAALSTPVGTVKSRLHRANRILATRLAHLRDEDHR